MIGVTGQMHGVVCLDADGEAIGPCLTVRDQRSTAEAEEIVNRVGREEIYALTGAYLDASSPAAKLLWLKCRRPSMVQQTSKFVLPKDYIRGLLTGQAATDAATDVIDAAGTLLFDISQRSWAAPLLEACEVPQEKLPAVLEPTDMAGTLQAEPAAELNLAPGIPIVLGAGDDIEALGAGLVEPGMTLEHIGTTGSILTCVDHFILDPEMKLDLYPWIDPSLWLLGGATNNAGGALAWARSALCGQQSADTRRDLRLRRRAMPGLEEPLIFLPYLSGERCPVWNPRVRGVFFGLNLQHTHDDLIQAVFEGVAFSLRHLLEYIEEMGGQPIDLIRGDVACDDLLWAQLRADIYGRDLLLVGGKDPTSLGTMLIAGVGIGLFSDAREAAQKAVALAHTVKPSPENAGAYRELFAKYKTLASDIQPLFGQFSDQGGGGDDLKEEGEGEGSRR